MAPHRPATAFRGGCSCSHLRRATRGCECGWGALADRIVKLADTDDPIAFVAGLTELRKAFTAITTDRRYSAIDQALAVHGGNVTATARAIGISRQRLHKII